MDVEIDKCKSDEVNDWFLNKFGVQARARPKKELDLKEKEKLSIERYKKMREQIEEQLAARRREDMQRRHRFYNADNELSNQGKHDDEEEEEAMTDEDEEEDCEVGSIKNDTVAECKDNDNNEMDDCEIGEEDDVEVDDEEDGDVENEEGDCDDDEDGDDCAEVVDDNSNSFIRNQRRKYNSFDGEEESLCKRPRLFLSSEDDMTCDKVVVIDEDSRTRFYPDPVVNNNGDGGEFCHITLDLNAATTNPPCSQDFNEALFLCSGTFAENEEASKSSVEKSSSPKWKNLQNDDLFTVEDDAEENTPAGSSWPIKWTEEEENNDDLEDENDGTQRIAKPLKIKDVLDDEASLSGDDVGGDSDDSDAGEEDDYEPEEGDNDELPDEEEIREKLVRQYIKQTNDDDERRMIQLQEQFFADSDLHSSTNMDRSFRFRMRDDTNVDWSKILGNLDDQQKENSDNEDDDDSAKKIAEKKIEMLKWRLEQEKKKCVFNDSTGVEYVEMFEKSSILMLGEKSITNKGKNLTSLEVTAAQPISTNDNDLATLRSRDSLLNKAGGSLRHVFKDTTAPTNNNSLFTSISKN